MPDKATLEAWAEWRITHQGHLDKESTEQVSLWICNDSDYRSRADAFARMGVDELGRFLRGVLSGTARARTPAVIHTRRHLSDYDLDCIDWSEVASDLLCE